MKTKKFIEEIKSMEFELKKVRDYIVAINTDGYYVAKASIEDFGVHSTDYVGFYELGYNNKLQLLYLLLNYSKTPIEDREEVEKYYLRQIGIGSWGFLNFNIDTQEYTVAGKEGDYAYKTQFTQSEIDNMPECYTHPAVWEKIKMGSED